ncbi:hypothetical protein ABZ070_00955 [Streptomyces sp. NPDC006283]
MDAGEHGLPPYRQSWNGAVYLREPFELESHDPLWHYCHRSRVC